MHLAAAPSSRLPPLPSPPLCHQVLPTIWHIYHSTNIYACRWRRDSAGPAEAVGVAVRGNALTATISGFDCSSSSVSLCVRACVKPLEIQPQAPSEKCLKKQHFLGITYLPCLSKFRMSLTEIHFIGI